METGRVPAECPHCEYPRADLELICGSGEVLGKAYNCPLCRHLWIEWTDAQAA